MNRKMLNKSFEKEKKAPQELFLLVQSPIPKKMKCARLHLQERFKPKVTPLCNSAKKPFRYCQKRMINPDHEEDPRWADAYERFRCLEENVSGDEIADSYRGNPDADDTFLSVQTLQFQGNDEQPKRFRSNFKYKSFTSVAGTHRMFVKQAIPEVEQDTDDDESSHITSYYFDDYAKYLFDTDKSRPTSGKSSLFLQSLSTNKEDKATQVDVQMGEGSKKSRQGFTESKVKTLLKKIAKKDIKDEIQSDDTNIEDTKITFRKAGRRKSLTISRAQSPEVMQVIRVDVVCNQNRSPVMSDYETNTTQDCKETMASLDIESVDLKKSHFAKKYLLTSTMKTLDEHLAGGEKVTLLCKTFKLTERSPVPLSNKPKAASEAKTNKKTTKTGAPKHKRLQDQISKLIFRFNNQ